MMLLKPNRKALDYPAWLYYDYFVTDFLNKLFAVSLLTDDSFDDLVRPLAQKTGMTTAKLLSLSKKPLSAIQERPDQSDSESSCTDLSFEQPSEAIAYSARLHK